ncbi:MAG: type II toxin-antitoxin system Phd/YefM family antitoxin [Spirochaetales bacterium]|nr:type II toxin-antitoxin system Phd/YefM family antitoxin [Spirochaetales bacterium]
MKEQSLDATKARREFFRLLGEVRFGGKRFIIQRWGRPHAILIPLPEYHRLKQQDLLRGGIRSAVRECGDTAQGTSRPEAVGRALAEALAREIERET